MATYVSAAAFQLAGIKYATIEGDEPAVAVIGWDNEYFLNQLSPSDPTIGDLDEEEIGPTNLVLPRTVIYGNVTYKLKVIENDAFASCGTLKELTIPNSVVSIGSGAFQDCVNLKKVTVQWTVPLAIDGSVFSGVNLSGDASNPQSGVELYVLSGYQAVYSAAEVWKNFKNIKGYADYSVAMAFKDPVVKAICLKWDTDGDGELTYDEARQVTNLGNVFQGNTEITSFTELRSFSGVKSIPASAFRGCTSLEEITMSSNTSTIGQEAFSGCTSLSKVTFQNALTTIGDYAFFGCSSLAAVIFPQNFTSIGAHAFDGCSSIKSFTIPAKVTKIGNGAFANCTANEILEVTTSNTSFKSNANMTYIVTYDKTEFVAVACGAAISSFTILADVKTIRPYALAGAKTIEKLNLNNVVTIGENAFEGASSLTSVTIPSTTTTIGNHAFADCESLYTLKIPTSVTSIGVSAFDGVAKGIRTQVEWASPLAIADGTFANAIPVSNGEITGRLFVPEGTENLYAAAQGWKWFNFFYEGTIADYAANIINFADANVAAICVASFDADNDGYVTYDEAAAVTAIDNQFQGAEITTFEELKYFTGLTSIGDNAFFGSTIKSLTLPNTIVSVGDNAFAFCNNLTSFNFPASVEYIGNGVLKSCASLTTITVDAENTHYDSGRSSVLFNKDHSALIQYPAARNGVTVTLPEGVTTIAPEAFLGASKMETLNLPASLTTIGEQAMGDCQALKNVKVMWATPLAVPANTFEGTDVASAKLIVPSGVEELYQVAPVWKDFGGYETFKRFVSFEDEKVEEICVANWDANKDGKLTYEEVEAITDLGTAFKGKSDISIFNELSLFTGLTSIADSAFYGCAMLTNITIPSNITSIGESAFEGCKIMAKPTGSGGNNLTSIGKKAFYGCEAFTSAAISEKVTYIGPGAYGNCPVLTQFTVSANNPNYRVLDQIIFTKDTSMVVAYPAGKTNTSFKVTKNYIKKIYPYAFSGASRLKSLELHMIDEIGDNAFEFCTGLTELRLSQYVTKVGESAFKDCINLQSITIPQNVTSIGDKAFDGMPVAVRCQVEWPTPLAIAEGTFSNFEKENVSLPGILFVPEGTSELYKNAPGWDFFTVVSESSMEDYDASIITFVDPLVKSLAVEAWDLNGDKQLSYDEAAAATTLGNIFTGKEINTFNELRFFTSLTEINDNAFKNTSLKEVTMPEGITRIGNSAFQGTAISRWNTLPGLTEIGDSAFAYNTGFTSLTISANIISLGTGAFKGCPNLKNINVQEDNENYSSKSGVLYNKLGNHLIQYPAAKEGAYEIADGVDIICEDAFCSAVNLTSVIIPLSVSNIQAYAFHGCTSLNEVTVAWHEPLEIEASVFEGVNVSNATLNVPKGSDVLYQITDVWKDFNMIVEYLDDVAILDFEDPLVKEICLKWDTNGDEELTVGEVKLITDLGKDFFQKDIVLFNELQYFTGLKKLPENAFRNCAQLEEIQLPSTITRIEAGAFSGCASLKEIVIPASVTYVGQGVFSNCSSLEKIDVNEGNTKLKSVDGVLYNKAVTQLGAFPGGKAGVFDIPASVTSLASYAFCGAGKLTNVHILGNITEIPEGAFLRCSLLKSINLPAQVTKIGNFAFSECPSLVIMKLGNEAPVTLDERVFRQSYPESARLYVPLGSKVTYAATPFWRLFGEILEYPNCDVNRDGNCDMLDAVDVVKFVIDTTVEEFDEYLADFDDDQYVTVADAVLLVNELVNGKASAYAQAAPFQFDVDEHLTLTQDANNVLSLCLESPLPYTAFQFDLTLPEACDVQKAQLSARKNGHQLLYNKIGERTYRFACLSINNSRFTGQEGALVNILAGNPEGDDLMVSNIKLITVDGAIHTFDAVDFAQPTGITEMVNVSDNQTDGEYYTLSGVRVDRPGKGVYIVNGKKVIIK